MEPISGSFESMSVMIPLIVWVGDWANEDLTDTAIVTMIRREIEKMNGKKRLGVTATSFRFFLELEVSFIIELI